MARWNEITKQQFQLSYFGTIPYDVSDAMPIHEREHVFGLLREQKDAEKKANEEAVKKVNAAKASAPRKARKRSRKRH